MPFLGAGRNTNGNGSAASFRQKNLLRSAASFRQKEFTKVTLSYIYHRILTIWFPCKEKIKLQIKPVCKTPLHSFIKLLSGTEAVTSHVDFHN